MIKFTVCWFTSFMVCHIRFSGCEEHPQDLCKEGCKQSPIDICTSKTEDEELPPLSFLNHWTPELNLCMFQGGNTVIIKPSGDEDPVSIKGGPLEGTFILDQLHFHWGTDTNNGTEHSIDGWKYAMEAHLVYYNCMFGCAQRAIGQQDGLAIIAIMIESKPTFYNCPFESIISNLYKLSCPGVTIPLPKNAINVFKDVLLTRQYYAYEGSLSTPPCCEGVTWMVFKNVVCIHCTQVPPFRQVRNCKGKEICSNVRELQPLNGRVVCDVQSTCPDCPDIET